MFYKKRNYCEHKLKMTHIHMYISWSII